MYYAERDPLIHQGGHEVHEREEASPIPESGPFYVCGGDPHETPCPGKVGFGEPLVNLTIKKSYHAEGPLWCRGGFQTRPWSRQLA